MNSGCRRLPGLLACAALCWLAACGREPATRGQSEAPSAAGAASVPARTGSVTVRAGDRADAELVWTEPALEIAPRQAAQERRAAARALRAGRLFEDAQSAIPLYRALLRLDGDDATARRGLARALQALRRQGDAALARVDDDADALARVQRIAAVLRTVAAGEASVRGWLERADRAEQLSRLNADGESQLRRGLLGEQGEGALTSFRQALALAPGQVRAQQGLAAVESALIGRAEQAAAHADFDLAGQWLQQAALVRGDAPTVADARARIEAERSRQVAALRDAGVADLDSMPGLKHARSILAEALRIARPGDPAAADLRERIELATHYGHFRPGQVFTDALPGGGRGPLMVVVPHGGFRMGAAEDEPDSSDAERPLHYVRFERGFALSRSQVTVAEFGRFVQASGYRPRATRRGHSVVYDERSGNFARRSGVDWRSDYAGNPAAPEQPVIHVSVRDAEAYAAWLGRQTGHPYRLPSEAEYEYAVRAGGQTRYPWGAGAPPRGTGNLAGGDDASPSGRRWQNAFAGYGDGWWGPAPAGRFAANAWGLVDMGSNVSEWVGDCWHAAFRRAPADGAAWYNPGCRARVVRGGGWSSAPAQARSAWRSQADSDMTSARVGFRVVRGL
ncbi:MAG: formylglycine-generating enzyme family protein [Pseudoxanthomonas sp.]